MKLDLRAEGIDARAVRTLNAHQESHQSCRRLPYCRMSSTVVLERGGRGGDAQGLELMAAGQVSFFHILVIRLVSRYCVKSAEGVVGNCRLTEEHGMEGRDSLCRLICCCWTYGVSRVEV